MSPTLLRPVALQKGDHLAVCFRRALLKNQVSAIGDGNDARIGDQLRPLQPTTHEPVSFALDDQDWDAEAAQLRSGDGSPGDAMDAGPTRPEILVELRRRPLLVHVSLRRAR